MRRSITLSSLCINYGAKSREAIKAGEEYPSSHQRWLVTTVIRLTCLFSLCLLNYKQTQTGTAGYTCYGRVRDANFMQRLVCLNKSKNCMNTFSLLQFWFTVMFILFLLVLHISTHISHSSSIPIKMLVYCLFLSLVGFSLYLCFSAELVVNTSEGSKQEAPRWQLEFGGMSLMGVGSPNSRGPVPRLSNDPVQDKGGPLCEGLEALRLFYETDSQLATQWKQWTPSLCSSIIILRFTRYYTILVHTLKCCFLELVCSQNLKLQPKQSN